MGPLEALLLGLLQGLSEFLPISSTAHLTIAGYALGVIDAERPQEWTAFLAVTQLGTLVAVIAYFWRDLAGMTRAMFPGGDPRSRKLAWLVVLGTIPIGVVGLLLRDVIEGPLTKDLRLIAFALIGLGVLLAIADRVATQRTPLREMGARTALLVGAAQVLSLVPGASRSGTTITGGLFAGLDRESATRFSFLLSIPAIGASGLLQVPAVLDSAELGLAPVLLAVAAAALSGYAAIWFLLRYVQRRNMDVFVGYRIVLGLAILLWLAL